MQTSTSGLSMGQALRAVVQQDGILGLFRGVQSPMAGLVAMNALVFQSFGWAKQALGERPGGDELSVERLFLAGGIAGAAVTLAEGPVDFLKVQLQVKRFEGLAEAARTVVARRGVLGLGQGFGATLARNVPANACWYGTFEAMRGLQARGGQRRSEIGFFPTLLAGGVAGVAYWTPVFFIDTINSQIQADHWDPAQRKYKGFLDAAAQIRAKDGIRGFYKGFSACLLRAFPASGATFATYSLVANYLDKK